MEKLKPLGYMNTDKGVIYYVESTDYRVIHKIKNSQLRPAVMLSLATREAWAEFFHAANGSIAWSHAYSWLIHSCMKAGEYHDESMLKKQRESEPKETKYSEWTRMKIGDWFYVDNETWEAAIFTVNQSKFRKYKDFDCEWLDSEGRGKITRIL